MQVIGDRDAHKGNDQVRIDTFFLKNKLLFAPFTWAQSNVIDTDAGCEIEIS